jgi:iron(III) transport system substrate-binding protein
MRHLLNSTLAILLAFPLLLALTGCGGDEADELVVYTSVDEPYSRPIIERFEAETGLKVRLVTDTEANKSVGLAERLRAEARRPVADVWWGNEPFLTVALADEGAFTSHDWPTAEGVLPLYRDAQGRWVGNGIRARGIAVAPGRADAPATLEALRDVAGELAIARPTAGTTASHAAALYATMGEAEADALFRDLAEARLVAGNGPSATAVAEGSAVVFGLTDNDDVANLNKTRVAEGLAGDVGFVLLDQASGGRGTLTVPTTVALVAKPELSAEAKRLADFLASPEVEAMLREMEFTLASTRESADAGGVRAMEVDYAEVARILPRASRRALDLLEGRTPTD